MTMLIRKTKNSEKMCAQRRESAARKGLARKELLTFGSVSLNLNSKFVRAAFSMWRRLMGWVGLVRHDANIKSFPKSRVKHESSHFLEKIDQRGENNNYDVDGVVERNEILKSKQRESAFAHYANVFRFHFSLEASERGSQRKGKSA